MVTSCIALLKGVSVQKTRCYILYATSSFFLREPFLRKRERNKTRKLTSVFHMHVMHESFEKSNRLCKSRYLTPVLWEKILWTKNVYSLKFSSIIPWTSKFWFQRVLSVALYFSISAEGNETDTPTSSENVIRFFWMSVWFLKLYDLIPTKFLNF